MKSLIILSTLLNFAFLGVVGAAYVLREDDSAFVVDFMITKDETEREVLRDADLHNWLAKAKEDGAGAPEEFKALIMKYARTDAEREAFAKLLEENKVVGVQRLLTDSASSQREALARERAEHETSIERIRMILRDFRDFSAEMIKREETLKNEKKDFDARRDRIVKLEEDASLARAITAIDEEKKAKDAVTWLKDRPTAEQYYIISRLAEPTKQTAILNALPEEDRAAYIKYKADYGKDKASMEVGPNGK